MDDQQILLDDDAMRSFITDGFVTVDADMPSGFHQSLYEQVDSVFESEGNPGNNILPRVPDISKILSHPRVTGALSSILGPDYHLHAHRHCHFRPPHSDGQRLHKDSWSRRHHRTRWCMLLYYPQDTTAEMGPTGVVPGSQYYNRAPGPDVGEEISLCGRAGTATVVHYDLWHRGGANTCDRKRYMLKFLITRMAEPRGPTWDGGLSEWQGVSDRRAGMWASTWRWHCGRPNGQENGNVGGSDADVNDLIDCLSDDDETACFQAAYALGAVGEAAVAELIDILACEDEATRRNGAYALAAVGAAAVPALADTATAGSAASRAMAAQALGELGLQAEAAVPALGAALGDADVEVRKNAAYALGSLGSRAREAVPALIDAVGDEDEWVRRNASMTLARLGPDAEEAVAPLVRLLDDECRYVQANAANALARIDSADSLSALFTHLATARWCPITTSSTPY